MKWTETLIIAVVAALLPFIAGIIKEFLSVFQLKAAQAKEQGLLELEKDKQFEKSVLEVMKFLEERNEWLSASKDKLQTEKDTLLRELYSEREKSLRYELRLEYRKSLENSGLERQEAIDRVDNIEEFNIDDSEAIIISDNSKNIIAVTDKAFELLGYCSLEEMQEDTLDKYLPNLHTAAFKAGVKGASEIPHTNKHTIGILGNPAKLTAIHKTGTRIPVTAVLKTWTDAKRILYAAVLTASTKKNLTLNDTNAGADI